MGNTEDKLPTLEFSRTIVISNDKKTVSYFPDHNPFHDEFHGNRFCRVS